MPSTRSSADWIRTSCWSRHSQNACGTARPSTTIGSSTGFIGIWWARDSNPIGWCGCSGAGGMLHVTNGDSVVESWRSVGLPGIYLPWRDVLHDGAVPQCDTLEQMSDVRAKEINKLGGYGDYDSLRAEFASRDATLE